jgi:uncharacterized protein YjbJ (UPF0337 family)
VIHYKEINMNWDIVEGNWKQFKGKIKAKWGKLSDDNLDVISGKRDQLAGKIQETYGVSKDEAEKQIEDFEKENQDLRHYITASSSMLLRAAPGVPGAASRQLIYPADMRSGVD